MSLGTELKGFCMIANIRLICKSRSQGYQSSNSILFKASDRRFDIFQDFISFQKIGGLTNLL